MPHRQMRRVNAEHSRFSDNSISGVKSKYSSAEMAVLHSQGRQLPKLSSSNLKEVTRIMVVAQARRARGRYSTMMPASARNKA